MTGTQWLVALLFAGAAFSYAYGQDMPAAHSSSLWEVNQFPGEACPFATLTVRNGCGDRDRIETVETEHGALRLGYDMRGGCFRGAGLPDIVRAISMPDGVFAWPSEEIETLEDGATHEMHFCVDKVVPGS